MTVLDCVDTATGEIVETATGRHHEALRNSNSVILTVEVDSSDYHDALDSDSDDGAIDLVQAMIDGEAGCD